VTLATQSSVGDDDGDDEDDDDVLIIRDVQKTKLSKNFTSVQTVF